MSYQQLVIEDIRLGVLQLLEEDADYAYNENLLQRMLEGQRAHGIGFDLLRNQLRWLEEQGLVTLDDAADVWTVRLTRRGEDVALGHMRLHGVARPAP